MSFLTTQPEELAAAAGKLETIGATMDAENVAAVAPTTTGVIPAAADEVSALQASLFTAYGTLDQQVSAEAATLYDMFVRTLGVSAGTYAAAETANSSAAAGTLNPLTTPAQIANPAGLASQAAAVSQAAAATTVEQVGLGNPITNVPGAVMGLASPAPSLVDATGLSTLVQHITSVLGTPFLQNAINGAVNTAAWFVMAAIPNSVFLGHTLNAIETAGAPVAADLAPALAPAAGLRHAVAPLSFGGAGVEAGLGQAAGVGKLSVPVGWSSAAPALTSGTTALDGSGWAVPQGSGGVD